MTHKEYQQRIIELLTEHKKLTSSSMREKLEVVEKTEASKLNAALNTLKNDGAIIIDKDYDEDTNMKRNFYLLNPETTENAMESEVVTGESNEVVVDQIKDESCDQNVSAIDEEGDVIPQPSDETKNDDHESPGAIEYGPVETTLYAVIRDDTSFTFGTFNDKDEALDQARMVTESTGIKYRVDKYVISNIGAFEPVITAKFIKAA